MDPQLVTKRRQHKSHSKPQRAPTKASARAGKDSNDYKPTLRVRVYDHEAMDAIAKVGNVLVLFMAIAKLILTHCFAHVAHQTLQQKKMVEPNEPSY